MNSDDDTVAAPSDTTVAASINTVAEVLFIGKKFPWFMSCGPASIDGWPEYRSTEHQKYRSPLNCVNWHVYSRNLIKFSTYGLFS